MITESQSKITAIIIAYNQSANLEICLKALEYCGWTNLSIMVIDNGSADGTAEQIMGHGGIVFLRLEKKERYTSVVNAALDYVEGEILLLGANYVMAPNALYEMMAVLENNEDIGAVNAVSSSSERFAADGGDKGANYISCVQDFLAMVKTANYRERTALEPGCILLRRKAVEGTGRFDDRFACMETALADYLIGMRLLDYKLATAQRAFVFYEADDSVNYELTADRKRLERKRGKLSAVDCNYGLLQLIRAEDSSMRVLGIGMECEADLQEIRNRFPDNVLCLMEDYRQLPAQEEYWDYIILEKALEYSEKPWEILGVCSKLLKPEGELLVSIANAVYVSFCEAVVKGRSINCPSYSYGELCGLIQEAGFVITEQMPECLQLTASQQQLSKGICEMLPAADEKSFGISEYHIRAVKTFIQNRRRVLVVRGQTPILDYIANQVSGAYRRLGWIVYEMNYRVLLEDGIYLMETLNQGVERAFLMNDTGWLLYWNGRNVWDIFGVGCINYCLDHPFYYSDVLDRAPDCGILACVDKNHVQYAQRFYKAVQKSVFLPLGGETKGMGTGKTFEGRRITVLAAAGYKLGMYEDLDSFAGKVITQMKMDPFRTLEETIEEALREYQEDITDSRIKAAVEKYCWIDRYLKQWARVEAVRHLVEAGIDVTVCGEGWNRSELIEKEHFEWKGCVTQEECLDLMRDSKIVLNVMPWFKNGIHDRVINAMLAGAICLTDGSIYLEEQFKKDEEYVSFSLQHMERLPEAVENILRDPQRVEKMRLSAYSKAVEHTWERRIEDLEQELKDWRFT